MLQVPLIKLSPIAAESDQAEKQALLIPLDVELYAADGSVISLQRGSIVHDWILLYNETFIDPI